MSVAVLTDSTAYLPAEVAREHGITVVALPVSVSGRDGREGQDVTPADVAIALQERRTMVTTSRPAPTEFADAYGRLLTGSAGGVVSVHISAKLSGTCDSATLAAADFAGRVAVVDSATAGMGVGFVALAAAAAAAAGEDLPGVRAAAERAAGRTTTLFYVDTLEFLRRGGRIGAASALLGTALSVKPILVVSDGEVTLKEKARTASRGLARLVDLAVEAGGESTVDIAVHHLAAPERADKVLTALRGRLGDRLRSAYVSEVGAVVAAHVGPGFAGVVVHRVEAP
jgi:DegV family protein with EDD domain